MTLTPEEIVFKTNSDSKSLIFVMVDKLVYVGKGAYGGYVLKPRDLGLEGLDENLVLQIIGSARAFYVVPEVERLKDLGEYAEIVQRYLNVLPEKVRREFENPTGVELITYKYVEVDARIKKCTENYAVLDFEPKPNGLKLTAKALRLCIHYQGSFRHPESTTAGRLVKEWKLEFPENEIIQKNVYARDFTGYKGRGSTIYLKIVLEAPRELVPASVVPATATFKEVYEKVKDLALGEELTDNGVYLAFQFLEKLRDKAEHAVIKRVEELTKILVGLVRTGRYPEDYVRLAEAGFLEPMRWVIKYAIKSRGYSIRKGVLILGDPAEVRRKTREVIQRIRGRLLALAEAVEAGLPEEYKPVVRAGERLEAVAKLF